MLPLLTTQGYLPPGIHPATLDELLSRFGHGSDQRLAQADSLRWLLPICREAGITRMLINGSFVTSNPDPNDVDCVLLAPPDYDESTPAAQQLLNGLPFLEIKVVSQSDYDWFASLLFASDRDMIRKGVVEVTL